MREVKRYNVFEKDFNGFRTFVVRRKLEVAKADMALCYTHQCGCSFNRLSSNRVPGTDHEQGAGGGNAQPVHGFAAQVFADSGAQNCSAITKTGVGRCASSFQVPVP